VISLGGVRTRRRKGVREVKDRVKNLRIRWFLVLAAMVSLAITAASKWRW
jgi:hypothetical protein